MRIERIDAFRFPVPFKQVFRHASASRARAENVIVAARSSDGAVGYGEGCPRGYVTGESVVSAHEFIAALRHELGLGDAVATVPPGAGLGARVGTGRISTGGIAGAGRG